MNKIKILYIITSFKQSGPTKQLLYIIKNLDRSVFDPTLISINENDIDEKLKSQYLNYLSCELVKVSKVDIILGRYTSIRKAIGEINPDVIHTLGLFPDFAITRMGFKNHILTLRDYCYLGHKDKYGFFIGSIMTKMQEYVMNHCSNVLTCSNSLSNLYLLNKNFRFDYIRNGVDVGKFYKPSLKQRIELRDKYHIERELFVFVYSGQFIPRKNQEMLVKAFINNCDDKTILLLLGDGPQLDECKRIAQADNRIIFAGNVGNVEEYLSLSDVYVSTSISEGMPNGVLEAMATGIPVLLSDIEQHKEIFSVDSDIGMLFCLNDIQDLRNKLNEIKESKKLELYGKNALELAHGEFSDESMSRKYQQRYMDIYKGVQYI